MNNLADNPKGNHGQDKRQGFAFGHTSPIEHQTRIKAFGHSLFLEKNGFSMTLLLIEQALIILASAISAYTDYKTGYIFDWITLPLIALGLGLRLWQQDWIGLGIGIAVFAFLYALYWTGKLGGGDVKLFTGMALVLPLQNGQFFLLNAIFFAAITALLFYSVYYIYKIRSDKIPIDWKTHKTQLQTAIAFGIFSILFIAILVYQNGLSLWTGILFAIPFLLASAFVAVENVVKQKFFLETIALSQLEEDEIIASEFMDTKQLAAAGLNLKKIIGETEKQKLQQLRINEVPVYRNAPRFGPFIFIGCVLAIAAPQVFSILFLSI